MASPGRGGTRVRRRTGDRRRGVALLLVLWVFMTLGVLALDFASYMRDDAMAAVNFSDETRGYYVALAGMNKALLDAMMERSEFQEPEALEGTVDQEEDEERQAIPMDGIWHQGQFAGATYEIRMTDLQGRISLNTAPPELLKRVVTGLMLGGDPTQSVDRRTQTAIDQIVDAILDWRDTDDLPGPNGAESDYYLDRFGYGAKDGWFDSVDDLLKVRGIDGALFFGVDGRPGLRDLVTIYPRNPDEGGAMLHFSAIGDPLLQVLLGYDEEQMADLKAARADPLFGEELKARLVAAEPSLGNLLSDEPPKFLFVEARADVTQDRNRSTVAAIVDIASEDYDGPDIKRWLDRAPWQGKLPAGSAGGELQSESGDSDPGAMP